MKNNYPEIRFAGYEIEWSMKKLGDITDIKDSSRISNTLWISNGVPYLRSSDLSNDNIKGELFLSKKTYQEYSAKTGAPTRGDLLFTSGGKIGVTYYKEDDDELYVQGGSILYAKTSESEHLNGRFLKSYFDTPILKKYIENASTGLTIKHFTLKPAKDTPIAIPELDEQKKIGLFFKNLDDTISLHQQELDALKKAKQSFLKKMFPENGENVPRIRFSKFTNNWECKKVKNVISLLKDGTHGTHKDGEYAYLLSAKNIKFGKVLLNPDQDRKIAKIDYKQIYKNYELENEDLLVTIVGTIGQTALYYKDDNAIAFQRSVGIIRGNEDVSQLFLKAIFDSSLIQKQLKKSSSISAQPGVYLGDLEKMTLMLPTIDEQIKIGEFFKEMDEVIDLKEQELEALKQTKKGFLQKMFV